MPLVTFIEPDGTARTLDIAVGTSVMMAAVDARIKGIDATCLGDCMCATCHVILSAADFLRLPPPSEAEVETLENVTSPQPHSRLSCQIILTPELDRITVEIPPI